MCSTNQRKEGKEDRRHKRINSITPIDTHILVRLLSTAAGRAVCAHNLLARGGRRPISTAIRILFAPRKKDPAAGPCLGIWIDCIDRSVGGGGVDRSIQGGEGIQHTRTQKWVGIDRSPSESRPATDRSVCRLPTPHGPNHPASPPCVVHWFGVGGGSEPPDKCSRPILPSRPSYPFGGIDRLTWAWLLFSVGRLCGARGHIHTRRDGACPAAAGGRRMTPPIHLLRWIHAYIHTPISSPLDASGAANARLTPPSQINAHTLATHRWCGEA